MIRDRERLGLWLMAAPFLAGIVVLVAVPAALTFSMSLFEWDLVRAPRFVWFDQFRELLGDEVFRVSMRNSLLYVATAVPIRLVLAVTLGLLLARRAPGAGALRGSVALPTVIPDVAYALLWLWILNPLYGPLNLLLSGLGLPTPAWLTSGVAARWGIVLMGAFLIGEGLLIAIVARRAVPDELYELAAEQGAGPLGQLLHVTLPLMAPALLLLVARDTIMTLQATFVPALVVTEGGPPPYETTYLPLFVYRNAFEFLRYGYAAAATTVMFVLTGAIVYLQYRLFDRLRRGRLLN